MPEDGAAIEISEATPADAAGIGYVQLEGWLTTYVNAEHGITVEDLLLLDFANAHKLLAEASTGTKPEDDTTRSWVAKSAGTVVGFSSAHRDTDTNKLCALYVLSEFRGMGLGKLLAERAIQWLGRDRDIVLTVASFNEHAIVFYQRLGFYLGPPVVHDEPVFASGHDWPEVEMRLGRHIA